MRSSPISMQPTGPTRCPIECRGRVKCRVGLPPVSPALKCSLPSWARRRWRGAAPGRTCGGEPGGACGCTRGGSGWDWRLSSPGCCLADGCVIAEVCPRTRLRRAFARRYAQRERIVRSGDGREPSPCQTAPSSSVGAVARMAVGLHCRIGGHRCGLPRLPQFPRRCVMRGAEGAREA